MKNIIKRLFQIKKVKVYCLSKPELLGVKPMMDCNILFVNKENYIRVLEMRNDNVSESFKNMLNDGQIGILAEVNGKIVSHAWMQIGKFSRNKYNGAYGKLKDNEGLIHFCNTSPEFRGNNLYPFLIYELATVYFFKMPTNILYITTSPDNYSSQKGLLKVGFMHLEDRLIFRILKYIKFEIKIVQKGC